MCFVPHIRILRSDGFRITAVLVGLFVLSGLTLMATMYRVTESALDANFIQSVEGDIDAVEAAYQSEGQTEVIEVITQLTSSPQPFSYYLLQDTAGNVLAGNLPPMTPVFGTASIPPPRTVVHPKEHTVYGKGKTLSDGTYLFVGADSHQLIEAHERIFYVFGIITLATSAAAIGAGVFLSAGFLRRIDNIVEICRDISSNKWDRRIPVEGSHTETNLLGTTINSMLDRLSSLMESLRQVSSDIAHDLRTPLTHMRQRLEKAQIEAASTEAYAAALERAILDSDEILALFAAMLTLSQIEASPNSFVLGRVNLTDLLSHLVEMYRPVAADHGQTLAANLKPGVWIAGDKPLLTQMFSNLVENAIRHCAAGTQIRIEMTEIEDAVIASVADNGHGIPSGERHRAFDRFWRAETSRSTPGHGLGLALVAAIAKAHHILIELDDNRPGLAVRLRLQAPVY